MYLWNFFQGSLYLKRARTLWFKSMWSTPRKKLASIPISSHNLGVILRDRDFGSESRSFVFLSFEVASYCITIVLRVICFPRYETVPMDSPVKFGWLSETHFHSSDLFFRGEKNERFARHNFTTKQEQVPRWASNLHYCKWRWYYVFSEHYLGFAPYFLGSSPVWRSLYCMSFVPYNSSAISVKAINELFHTLKKLRIMCISQIFVDFWSNDFSANFGQNHSTDPQG